MIEATQQQSEYRKLMKMPAPKGEPLYPDIVSEDWTRADYGELWIPKKGASLKMGPRAWQIYGRVIRDYEGNHDAQFRDGKTLHQRSTARQLYVQDGLLFHDGRQP